MIKASLPPVKISLAFLSVILLIGTAFSSSAATSIGASFVGRGSGLPNGQAVLKAGDSAGVVPQQHWNNVFENDTTFQGQSGNLSDSAGNWTSVVLIYEGSDAWFS